MTESTSIVALFKTDFSRILRARIKWIMVQVATVEASAAVFSVLPLSNNHALQADHEPLWTCSFIHLLRLAPHRRAAEENQLSHWIVRSMGTNTDMHAIIAQSLTSTQHILEAFHVKRATFLQDVPSIVFTPDCSSPLPLSPPQPPLGLNERFLFHLEAVNRDLDALDAIPTYNDVEARQARKAAIAEVLQHLEYLDGLVSAAWTAVLDKENLAESSLNAIETATQGFQQELQPFKHGFIAHRDRVSKILETLDAVPSHGIQAIRITRKTAVDSVVEYITKLDSWINGAYEQSEQALPVDYDVSKINRLLHALHVEMVQFDTTARPVTFRSPGQGVPFPITPPPLPTFPNKEFLRHQSAVENILDSMDRILSGDTATTKMKSLAIKEAKAHLAFLTTMVDHAWEAFLDKERIRTGQRV